MPRTLALFALLLAACSGPESTTRDDAGANAGPDVVDTGSAADADDGRPEPICTDGTSWSPGTAAFREATADWGLDAIGVEGTRISVGDIDGDGKVDLLVRRGGTRTNDWADDGARHTWLLRNTGAGFEDVTRDSGLDDNRFAYGDTLGRPVEIAAFGDVDNDGDLDVFTGISTEDTGTTRLETSELMLNAGAGVFSFTAQDNAIRREGETDAVAGASFVDFDRDGNLDVWVGEHNYEPAGGGIAFQHDRLYRGDGTGAMTDVSAAAGVVTLDWDGIDELNGALSHSRAWSTVACDLNNDGTTELLAASYGRAPSHLWVGERGDGGSVTYANRSVTSGYAYDEDESLQDNEFARCFCSDNPDAEGCEGATDPRVQCRANWNHANDREPFRLGGNSGATVCADLDNDGWMDLLTTEIRHWWAGDGADGSDILLNTGDPSVVFDRSRERETMGFIVPHVTGTSWDEGHMSATVLDFDNDGWPDFYIGASDYAGNRGMLFHQQQAGFWELLSVDDSFEHNRSHGVAAADFDRDGDLDLLVGHSRSGCDDEAPNDCYPTQQVRLFENVIGDQGNWIQLHLEGGPGTNRAAIGARVEVTAGDVTQTQEVGGGYGHYGAQNDLVLHFGLGAACEADVTIRWPDAPLSTQSFRVVSGHRYAIVQGAEGPTVAD